MSPPHAFPASTARRILAAGMLATCVVARAVGAVPQDPTTPPPVETYEETPSTLLQAARDARTAGQTAEARAAASEGIEILLAGDAASLDADTLDVLAGLGDVAFRVGDPRTALRAQHVVLERRLATSAAADDSVLKARLALAQSAYMLQDHLSARDQFVALLAAREATLPPDAPVIQYTRGNLAAVLKELGDLKQARELEEQAIAVLTRIRPPDDPDLLQARHNYATTLEGLGEVQRAREILTEVIALAEAVLPPDDSNLQYYRHSLALTLISLGEIRAARPLIERVLEVRSRALPPDHPMLLGARMSLVDVSADLGEVESARRLAEALLEDAERSVSGSDKFRDIVRGRLAVLLSRSGDAAQARVLQERVLTAMENRPGSSPRDLLTQRVNLAAILITLGERTSTRALLERALAEAQASDVRVSDLDRCRLNLASVLERLGQREQALAIKQEISDRMERELPADDSDLQVVHQNLAVGLIRAGDSVRAREVIEKVLAVYAAAGDTENYRVRRALTAHVTACAIAEDAAGIQSSCERWIRVLAELLDRTASYSPREAAETLSGAVRDIDRLDSCAPLATDRAALGRKLFELGERARDLSRAGGSWPAAASDPALEAQREIARRARAAVADLVAGGGQDKAEFERRIRERDRAEAAAREMSTRSLAPTTFDVARIAAALPDQGAAVTFRRTYAFVPQALFEPGLARLIAFVLTKDGQLTRLDLGLASPIEAATLRWRDAIGAPLERGLAAESKEGGFKASEERAAGEALRALVIDPILKAAPDTRRWIVCLDDVLHLVPLDALPLGDGLLGDRIEWRVASSLGEILRPRARHAGAARMVAVGGVDFNEGAESAPDTTRGRSGARWGPLAETRAEASNLGELFRQSFDTEPVVLTGKSATKAAFCAALSGARFVHVATHGYFAPESVKSFDDAAPSDRGWSPLTSAEAITGLAPMALCGLALAGANRGPDAFGRVPGILTAEELAGLDLSQCELAVLSACETNVGLRRAGIGIQSLQAALHAAGARAAITSLWKVDDEAARKLFEDFYTRVWVEHEPKGRALWAARMALRAEGRPTRDWATWVLSGADD